jgi:serine/threonine protein kinase
MPIDASKPELTEIGAYTVLAKVAEGGMGTVYKACRRDDGVIVAIKIIPPTAARTPILMQRFKREFNAARQIDHPNVVKAIEFCDAPPSPYLVMEFVDGESLGQKIEREGKISEDDAKRIMAQVCQGLHRAHKQNMVHRDIKPDNILLTHDGIAKITDLGLVKDIEGEMNLTRTGRGLGTPHFMAPEQFRNAKNADIRCDVYSLGATLYMMVTGKMPFDGCGPLDAWMKKSSNEFPAPRELEPGLSERMDWAIRRAMHSNPEMRPASCREFIEDLLGQSTRQGQSAQGATADLWYMVYRDDDGAVHTVKGTTDNIRKAFRERLLGDASNIRASRSKQGPFQTLQSYPQFRDLVVDPDSAAGQTLPAETTQRASDPTVPTPPPATMRRPASDAVGDGTTAKYEPQSTGRWSGPSGRFPTSTPASRIPPPNSQQPTIGTFSLIIWGIVIVLAIVLGVAAVLLLK